MIVLKILLYILLAVAGIILLILVVPAGGEVSYIDGKLSYKAKLWFLNLLDSEGGGLYNWWKKRRAGKPSKPKKPKAPKPVKEKKQKKKKQREQYEWEKELEDIPVNDPEAEAAPDESAAVSDSAENNAADISASESAEPSKTKKSDKSDDKAEEDPFDDDEGDKPDDDDNSSSLSDKIEKLVAIWESAQRPMLKIFKGFKLSDLYIDFVIADEDAYDCALKYGKYSTLIYSIIAFFSELFTVRLKTVDVQPQFGVSKGRWDISAKLSVRLGTMVIAGAWFLITYVFRTFLPEKIRKHKMKKSAARQK
ncbi:MAG: hypothetical protein K6G33_08125 [Ruminococcus sp.]|uniref:hypothetical protein n=1 Tax=Ruminococcus sp. TaxID=41978 RepID=UPI0025FECAA6|nr:hypothetical protein [Ruminococcus sp.]MCR5600690.1 hypothetical protein [Ruminococcus sp.]